MLAQQRKIPGNSSEFELAGEQFTNINVLADPPKLS
jgi:hypothetical protein